MALQEPDRKRRRFFHRHQVEGVEVFTAPGLMVAGPALRIKLGGFWKMRWLKVEGVATPATACAM